MPQVSDQYLENRKKKIAESALNVFSEKGYSNTSMKDIMHEAKVSRGGLYAHFENIDSVFIASLKYDDSLQSDQLLTPHLNKPLLSQLNNWIYQTMLSVQNSEVNLIRAKSEFFLSHNADKVPYLRERHDNLSLGIRNLIRTGIEKKEFKEDIDVSAFCELLISMMDGVMIHQHYQYASSASLLDIVELMMTMVKKHLIMEGKNV